jgi:hypothetical protein
VCSFSKLKAKEAMTYCLHNPPIHSSGWLKVGAQEMVVESGSRKGNVRRVVRASCGCHREMTSDRYKDLSSLWMQMTRDHTSSWEDSKKKLLKLREASNGYEPSILFPVQFSSTHKGPLNSSLKNLLDGQQSTVQRSHYSKHLPFLICGFPLFNLNLYRPFHSLIAIDCLA